MIAILTKTGASESLEQARALIKATEEHEEQQTIEAAEYRKEPTEADPVITGLRAA